MAKKRRNSSRRLRGGRLLAKSGVKEGWRNGAIHAARNMIADGSLPLSKVAEFSGLSIGEVESLKSSIRI